MIPVRVLIIGPSAREIVGGQEVEADLLRRRWQADLGVKVSFIPSNPALPKWMRPMERVPYFRTVARLPIYVFAVWGAISNIDVLHVFSASYSSFLLTCLPVWLISRWQGKRLILNYHTARLWEKFANSVIVRIVLQRTDTIVVPSAFLAGKFEELGFSVSVILNIIDDQFHYHPRINPRPRIICARNLNREYGIDVVINAFSIVQEHYPDASLYLIGDGPLRQDLEAQVRALGLSEVEFCGRVPNDRMCEWYERADIFLNASVIDNAPLSILEAFACGLPVVTTSAGGIPFLVKHEDTALVAPVGDARTLAEQVIRLLRDPELATKLTRQAYEQLGPHRWSSVRGKWLDVYTAKE